MNSDKAAKVACISSIITSLVTGLLLSLSHFSMMDDFEKGFQQDAVNHNFAEWVVDQKTGITSFKWRTDETKIDSKSEE